MEQTEEFWKWLESEEDWFLLARLRAREVSEQRLAYELKEEWGSKWEGVDWLRIAEYLSESVGKGAAI